MAFTQAPVTVLASVSVPAGGTKAAPNAAGIGAAIGMADKPAACGLGVKITNGASAPGVACSVTAQTSHNGTDWYDYQTVTGTTTASDVSSFSITIERWVMNLRVIAYGNTTNPVTVEAYLQAVTGL